MTTSAIENPRDRIATIMIAPFMSCSARLPVYTLMIAAFFRATGLRDRNNFFRGRDVERANSRRLESLNQLVALSLMVLLCSLVSACHAGDRSARSQLLASTHLHDWSHVGASLRRLVYYLSGGQLLGLG